MQHTFSGEPTPDEGFDLFWSRYPRDPKRRGRKSSKGKAAALWRKEGLAEHRDKILAALEEDLADIAGGRYRGPMSTDTLCYFPGVLPWLRSQIWDRDIDTLPAKPTANLVELQQPDGTIVRMTRGEYQYLLDRHHQRLATDAQHPKPSQGGAKRLLAAALVLVLTMTAGAAPRPSPIDRIPRPVLWELEQVIRLAMVQIGTEWLGYGDANRRWGLARSHTDYREWRAEIIQNMPGDPETTEKAARLIGTIAMTTILTEQERADNGAHRKIHRD